MEPNLSARRTYEMTDPAMADIARWIESYTSWEKLGERTRTDLARRAHLGDSDALDAMCNHNMRLVLSRAFKKVGRGVPLPDLVQEGWCGLRLAAQKYDPRRGTQFSGVAVWWIDRALRDAIIKQGRAIYLPHHASEHLARIAMRAYYGEPVRPTDQAWMDRLARELSGNPKLADVTLDYFDHLRHAPLSIDVSHHYVHSNTDVARTFADILPAASTSDPTDTLDLSALLLTLVNIGERRGGLSRREGWLVVRHFGLDGEGGRTYLELAREMAAAATKAGTPTQAVSRQRIEQLVSAAMRKVRLYVGVNRLDGGTSGEERVYLGEQRKRLASVSPAAKQKDLASPKTKSVRRTSDDSSKTTASRLAAPIPTPLRAKSSTKTAKGSSRHTKGSGLDVPYAEAI